MSSTTIFFIFVPFLAFALILINFIFAPHNPYREKNSVFECGYHSFLGQNRTQFNISFFVFALLFLLFDLEIVLIYPYTVSAYNNGAYGLFIMLMFFIALTIGLGFELGKKALNIDSRQKANPNNNWQQGKGWITRSISKIKSLLSKYVFRVEIIYNEHMTPENIKKFSLLIRFFINIYKILALYFGI